ncbi:lysostaphin resistance A-like protein [Planctomycetota bacterium]
MIAVTTALPSPPHPVEVVATAVTLAVCAIGLVAALGNLVRRRRLAPPRGPSEEAQWTIADAVAVGLVYLLGNVVLHGALIDAGLGGDPIARIGLGSLVSIGACAVAFAMISARGQSARALGLCREGAPGSAWSGLVYLLAAFPFIYGLVFVSHSVAAHLGVEPAINLAAEVFVETESRYVLLLICFVAVFVAPVAEEVFFRGLLYGPLRTHVGKAWAIAITSVCFALVHPLVDMPAIALLGVVLALAYERTGSLVAPISAHAANNVYGLALLAAERMART